MGMVGAKILYLCKTDQWEASAFTDRKPQFVMFPEGQNRFIEAELTSAVTVEGGLYLLVLYLFNDLI